MGNKFIQSLEEQESITNTENGATAYNTTLLRAYDLFALGGAYRSRSDEDIIDLFRQAYNEDADVALKTLFYLRDVRGGQGERHFFRVAMKWLCQTHTQVAIKLLKFIPFFGRYDDLWECSYGTDAFSVAVDIIWDTLQSDLIAYEIGEPVTLLAKWLPSENASNKHTKEMAKVITEALNLTRKDYRKTLSKLRERIKVIERLMSQNRWDEIKFEEIPSCAGMKYAAAFSRREIIKEQYRKFIESDDTKVHADTLYPYDVIRQIKLNEHWDYNTDKIHYSLDVDVDRDVINKYWNNLPDYFNGKENSMLCIVDTSGSMQCGGNPKPTDVANGLAIYAAEHNKGEFANQFITFSSNPHFVKFTEDMDVIDKQLLIRSKEEMANTDLLKTFELLRSIALENDCADDLPESLVVISDMEIDWGSNFESTKEAVTEMAKEREIWKRYGLKMPKLVYWNVDARNNIFLEDCGPDITFVSGCSPIIFKSLLSGKTGLDVFKDMVIDNKRYADIKVYK